MEKEKLAKGSVRFVQYDSYNEEYDSYSPCVSMKNWLREVYDSYSTSEVYDSYKRRNYAKSSARFVQCEWNVRFVHIKEGYDSYQIKWCQERCTNDSYVYDSYT